MENKEIHVTLNADGLRVEGSGDPAADLPLVMSALVLTAAEILLSGRAIAGSTERYATRIGNIVREQIVAVVKEYEEAQAKK
jgi:hypothetical protein